MSEIKEIDVALIGAGIMSATLGVLLKQLDPNLSVCMFEKLQGVAGESSDAMNNAGTGHAAYCELNYTPQQSNGTMDIKKATNINAAYENTLELWSYLVREGILPEPNRFINKVPHISFVWGEDNISFLEARFKAMKAHHLFEDMEYSENRAILEEWMPLVFRNRSAQSRVAATRIQYGTDVDFGAVTRYLVNNLEKTKTFKLYTNSEVKTLQQTPNGRWNIKICNPVEGICYTVSAKFVFLGAGGGSVDLLAKSGIPESKGYAGFPVTGQWMVCNNEDIIQKHAVKVYGKASIGAPPMSVPHLDTRIIKGKKALLFGPYAGFSTKFLKQGSYLDLIKSLNANNILPMIQTGIDNIPLTKYLIGEVLQSQDARISTLKQYFPDAQAEDWKLANAGQRVQIIKKDPKTGRGKLEFGTEVVTSKDGTIAALLGASPGASTAVKTMVQVLERCFAQNINSSWKDKLKEMIPSYGESLENNKELLKKVRQNNLRILQLQ